MGSGTKLAKRLKRGDPSISRLDKIDKQHNIDYSHAKNMRDKWKADAKMINIIRISLPLNVLFNVYDSEG